MPLFSSIHDDAGDIVWFRRAAILAIIVFVPLIVLLQWLQRDSGAAVLTRPRADLAVIETPQDPGLSRLTVASKVAVRLRGFAIASRSEGDEAEDQELLTEIEYSAITRAERLRAAIVMAELAGAETALSRLETLAREADSEGELAREIQALRAWYPTAGSNPNAAFPVELADSFRLRHGWFADLALSFGKPDGDQLRWQTVGGGHRLTSVASWSYGTQGIITLVGIIAAIGVVGRIRSGEVSRAYDGVSEPDQVYVESFAVFLGAFFTLLVASVFVIGSTSVSAVVLTQSLLLAIAATMAWPMLRGCAASDTLRDLGFHRGEGVAKEIAFGVMGYLAAAPLAIAGIVVAIGVEAIFGPQRDAVGFPMYEEPLGGSWTGVVLGALAAVLWAPFVEEALFRGALYGWLRVRLHWGWSIAISSALFGLIHPYSPSGLVQVAISGIALGMLREWRGSLIAPITAHLLHNAVLTATSIAYLLAAQ